RGEFRRRFATKECLHRRSRALRSPRQQTSSFGNPELPPVSRARNRNPAASRGARAGKNRLGCISRNLEASRHDRGPRRVSLRARRGGGFSYSRFAFVWRLSSEPAKYADRAADAGNVREGAATHPAISGVK